MGKVTWSRRTFDFSTELQKGNKGERWLSRHYHSSLVKFSGREFDFIREDNKRVELKTDWYNLANTEFMFIERWSDVDKKKPGGPWQSQDKTDIFVYLFIRDGVYFEFDDMDALVNRLEDLTKKLKLIRIRNRGYSGGGYKVPLADLADLYVDYRLYWSVDDGEL
jgi:hypothetical protein